MAPKLAPERQGRGISGPQWLRDSSSPGARKEQHEGGGRGEDPAAHRGVKVPAEKTRRGLCSKWQSPNSADFGQAQAMQGDACKELWNHSLLLTKPGPPQSVGSPKSAFPSSRPLYISPSPRKQGSELLPYLCQVAGKATNSAYPPSPLRRGTLLLYLAFIWSATPQEVLILTSFLSKSD